MQPKPQNFTIGKLTSNLVCANYFNQRAMDIMKMNEVQTLEYYLDFETEKVLTSSLSPIFPG